MKCINCEFITDNMECLKDNKERDFLDECIYEQDDKEENIAS